MNFLNPLKILLAVILISITASGQSKWYANSSLQIVGSEFQDGGKHNSFFFYNGVRYQTRNYYLSLSVPVIFGSENTFTQFENSYMPNDNGDEHMLENGGMRNLSVGFGDIYLNGSLSLIKESSVMPNISLDGYVKFPTASANLGVGTGAYDYQIAFGLKKYINRFSFFGQFGYLFLGKIAGAETINPFTFSVGVGYAFGYGEHSVLLAYDSYSTIIQGAASPRQLALGYNYMIHRGLFLTTILSAGLNSSTSDYTFSGGLNFEL